MPESKYIYIYIYNITLYTLFNKPCNYIIHPIHTCIPIVEQSFLFVKKNIYIDISVSFIELRYVSYNQKYVNLLTIPVKQLKRSR